MNRIRPRQRKAKTRHEDGVYWEYEYDDRYRLIAADRYHASGNVRALYSYTYDDGDNMITDHP